MALAPMARLLNRQGGLSSSSFYCLISSQEKNSVRCDSDACNDRDGNTGVVWLVLF